MRVINLSNLQQFTAVNLSSDPGDVGGPVVIPNTIQVNVVWTLTDGKLAANVLYASVSGAFQPTVTIANNLLTGLNTGASWTALAAFMPNTLGLAGVRLRDVRTANQPLILSTAAAAAGSSASPALPDETAVVVTLRTALAGAQNRGRMFVPGWATNALATGNVIAAAAVTALNNWANTIPTVMSGQGMTFSLGLRERAAYTGITGTQHPARPARAQPITSQSVRDNHWDTQRRRGLK